MVVTVMVNPLPVSARGGRLTEIDAQQSAPNAPGEGSARHAASLMAAPSEPCSESEKSQDQPDKLSSADYSATLRIARSLASCQQYDKSIARYREVLRVVPDDQNVLAELAEVMLRAHHNQEAAQVSEHLLELNPKNSGAHLLLARALGASGSYADALTHYDEALKSAPDDYDALDGKGHVLYWMRRYSEARAVFQRLLEVSGGDAEVKDALREVELAEKDVDALRPGPEASAEEFFRYYQRRLSAHPGEKESMKGLAYNRARSNDREGAIRDYRAVLSAYPDDRDSKLELARLLAASKQYGAAIRLYRDVLAKNPTEVETLESLARVYVWAASLGEAAEVYKKLVAEHPANLGYRLQTARLEIALKQYSDARQNLLPLLAADPQNREARLLLAESDFKRRRYRSSLEQFRILLRQDPANFAAAFGEAQITYYQDHLLRAETLGRALVNDQPQNFDAVMLLASIERARRHEREALELLDRADRIKPNDPEVRRLRERVRQESAVTVHTSASYAREFAKSAETGAPQLSSEDLRMSTFGTTVERATLPRTISYLSVSYLPSSSPFGAIQGAVAPAEFLYRQSSAPIPHLTFRGGIGLVRFGPGADLFLPGQPTPVPAAGIRPIGLAGLTWSPRENLSLKLDWTHSAVDYTPQSVRLGVIEQRTEARVNLIVDPRTELLLNCYASEYSSETYLHTVFINPQTITTTKADRNQARGASVVLNRELLRRRHFVLHAGYSGLAYGFGASRRQVFLGFFNPGFYQRHLLTTRLQGRLTDRVSYDFFAATGLQQVERGQALDRAVILNPAFTFKASDTLSFTLGYTHYDAAQTLGIVRGNAVKLSSDFRF